MSTRNKLLAEVVETQQCQIDKSRDMLSLKEFWVKMLSMNSSTTEAYHNYEGIKKVVHHDDGPNEVEMKEYTEVVSGISESCATAMMWLSSCCVDEINQYQIPGATTTKTYASEDHHIEEKTNNSHSTNDLRSEYLELLINTVQDFRTENEYNYAIVNEENCKLRRLLHERSAEVATLRCIHDGVTNVNESCEMSREDAYSQARY